MMVVYQQSWPCRRLRRSSGWLTRHSPGSSDRNSLSSSQLCDARGAGGAFSGAPASSVERFLRSRYRVTRLYQTKFMLHLPGGPYHIRRHRDGVSFRFRGEILFPVLLSLALLPAFAALGLLGMTAIVRLPRARWLADPYHWHYVRYHGLSALPTSRSTIWRAISVRCRRIFASWSSRIWSGNTSTVRQRGLASPLPSAFLLAATARIAASCVHRSPRQALRVSQPS